MIARRAHELTVVALSAETLTDLEDVVNDWLRRQLDHVFVQDISFQHVTAQSKKPAAWVVVTHEPS